MKQVATILYGSQNYYLDGPDSDHDYKIIMMPEFEDFYKYHKVEKNDLPDIYDHEHYNVMSILTFDKNIRKGNINALEMLFSHYTKCAEDIEIYLNAARRAYSEGYLFIIWDSFMATVEGMIKNSLDRYGATRKSTSRALYLINLCRFVAEHDFAIDRYTWGYKEVFSTARELRFNEEVEIPTKEVIFAAFEGMKKEADNWRDYHLLMHSETELGLIAAWDDDLANCMKTVVKKSLRSEL